jgi:hypothetical protein
MSIWVENLPLEQSHLDEDNYTIGNLYILVDIPT